LQAAHFHSARPLRGKVFAEVAAGAAVSIGAGRRISHGVFPEKNLKVRTGRRVKLVAVSRSD
jgi:hypothetical protein